MNHIDWLLERRRVLPAVYSQAFGDHPRLIIQHVSEYVRPKFQSCMIRICDVEAEERNRIISPLYPQMSEDDQSCVIEKVLSVI